MTTKLSLLAAASTIAFCVSLGSQAIAQDEAVASEGGGLDTVIVTSQRREENLQSTPLSIQNFSADDINTLDAQDIESLGNFASNVSIGDGTGRGRSGAQIAIRGIGEARVSPVLDPAVGIYIDDVYYGRPQTAYLRLLDVERVEVLRGPQGTLFGKNAVGGALRYITKKPEFDDYTGFAEITGGSRNRVDAQGALNIPVSDVFAMRISGGTLNQDGFLERLSDGVALGDEATNSVMFKARWAPSDKTDVNFSIDYTASNTDNGPQKLFDYPGALGETAAVSPATGVGGWNRYWGGTEFVYDVDIPLSLYEVAGEARVSENETDSWGGSLDIVHQLTNSTTVRLIGGYRQVDQFSFNDPDDQETARTFFGDISEEGVDFWSTELQVNGNYFDDRLAWVAGVFYSNEEPFSNDLFDVDGRNGPPGPNRQAGHLLLNDTALQETRSLGLYTQATFDLTEKLALTGGIRYTRDDKNYTVSQIALWDFDLAAQAAEFGLPPFRASGVGGPPNLRGPLFDGCSPITTPEGCVVQAPVSGGEVFDAITWRGALEYQATDDLMFYASVSTGFKAGGTNDSVDDITTPFDPETVTNYEGGFRSEFFDNRARLNVTGFYMDYDDKQITVTAADECENRCTTNVGSGRIYGAEVEALAAVTDNLNWFGNFGWLEAEWSEITNPTAGVSLDSAFSRAPRFSLSTGINHSYELSNGLLVNTSVNYAYRGEQESSPQDSTTITIPAYDLVGARISLEIPDQGVSLSVFCTNCAGEEYITGGASWAGSSDNTPFDFKPSTHPAYASGGLSPTGFAPPSIGFVNVGEPRVIGVELRKEF